jgi:hypothetical protein
MKIVGLYLWYVSLRNASINLWVTTRSNSIGLVAAKAQKTLGRLKKKGEVSYAATIDKLEYRGFIDA